MPLTASPARHPPVARARPPGEGRPAGGLAPALQVTARGAVLVMFSVFFPGILTAGWLDVGVLPGLSFAVGALLAAWCCNRSALLTVTLSPPVVFLTALIAAEAVSSPGGSLRLQAFAVATGTLLTLARTASWLLAGTVLTVLLALSRGLTGSIRQLRAAARGDTLR